jgi:hypothetical protein
MNRLGTNKNLFVITKNPFSVTMTDITEFDQKFTIVGN